MGPHFRGAFASKMGLKGSQGAATSTFVTSRSGQIGGRSRCEGLHAAFLTWLTDRPRSCGAGIRHACHVVRRQPLRWGYGRWRCVPAGPVRADRQGQRSHEDAEETASKHASSQSSKLVCGFGGMGVCMQTCKRVDMQDGLQVDVQTRMKENK